MNDNFILQSGQVENLLYLFAVNTGNRRRGTKRQGGSGTGRDHRGLRADQRGDALANSIVQFVDLDEVLVS